MKSANKISYLYCLYLKSFVTVLHIWHFTPKQQDTNSFYMYIKELPKYSMKQLFLH